jgi:hypothetical protein
VLPVARHSTQLMRSGTSVVNFHAGVANQSILLPSQAFALRFKHGHCLRRLRLGHGARASVVGALPWA